MHERQRQTAQTDLPIAALRGAFLEALAAAPGRPIVLSSPTGSGKSTEVPRWCAERAGPVLVIEPRRVACRSLAARVASLEATAVGEGVGYVVRDESVIGSTTRIVFATPGIVLRDRSLLANARTVVLDEFHERSLDVDLLLALLLRPQHAHTHSTEKRSELVIMSATLDGERIANHVSGIHLSAEGRTFPVAVRYLASEAGLPDSADLPQRLRSALAAAAAEPGDVLAFLPGKAEIEACRHAVVDPAWAVLTLHGGVPIEEERRAFLPAPAGRRKLILATNVAETSITIPGVGVVVDSGLVRQTRYHEGRGALVLAPIANDAAAQRAGRAGRTAAGVCFRMWSASAKLAERTLPEIHRESLVPLVMCAAAWGERVEQLRLLDPPKPFALEAARNDLLALGALSVPGVSGVPGVPGVPRLAGAPGLPGPTPDEEHLLSEAGRALFALPLDVPLARFLVETRNAPCFEDAIDLVAALATGRPMFLSGSPPDDASDDLRRAGCDVTALVRAVRIGRAEPHRLSSLALEEARRIRAKLRRNYGLSDANRSKAPEATIDREGLARAAMSADPRGVHVARSRGRADAFSNGGTELTLAHESAVQNARDVEAIVVFDARAFGATSAGGASGGRAMRLIVTCATPIPLSWIARARLGTDRLAGVRMESGRVVAQLEHVYANCVVERRDESPKGDLARAAITELFVRGSIFKAALPTTRERLTLHALAAKLATQGHAAGVVSKEPVLALREWVAARLVKLGVETGDDLALLSPADLTAPDVPYESRAMLEREFPLVVSVGDATYDAEYDLDKQQVVLRMVRGNRKDPPPLSYLPRFAGLRIVVDGPRGVTVLRQRG